MGTFTIRAAEPADAEAIARVHTESWWETYRHILPDHDHPAYDLGRRITMWRQNLDGAGDGTLVGVDDTGVAGFATVGPARDDEPIRDEELAMIYVLARAHGTGLGQALLDAVLGERPASLWAAADNPRALAFYRRNGFVADGATGTFGPIGATVRLVR